MLGNRNGILAAAIVSASLLSLSAGASAKTLKYAAGIVAGDGSIVVGTGFSVSHDGTGQYTVTYPSGSFGNAPVFSCNPSGFVTGKLPICNVYNYVVQNGGVQVQFRMYTRSDGKLTDNSFHFLEITAK